MTPEDVVELIVADVFDIYDEIELREWLRESGGCVDVLPSDLRSHIGAIPLKRNARDVYMDFPHYVNIPEFLEYWNRLSISARLAHMLSDSYDETPFDCWE